jgi:uncharacterized protein YegJ (DUF2314 family)
MTPSSQAASPIASSTSSSSPPAVAVASIDQAMTEAASAAQRSLPLFRRRLEQETGLEAVYGVRIVEHGTTVWLESVQFRDDDVSGLVDAPTDARRVRTVAQTAIVDWVIVDHDGIHGGYTLRLERERLTPDEQRIFDSELGAVFLPLP